MAKVNSDACSKCNALCCRYVAVEFDEPESEDDWDEIKWMLCHENVIVYKDNDSDWVVEFQTRCKNLGPDNKCRIYSSRPKICKDHSPDDCQRYGDGEVYTVLFEKPEDVDAYREFLKKGPVDIFPKKD